MYGSKQVIYTKLTWNLPDLQVQREAEAGRNVICLQDESYPAVYSSVSYFLIQVIRKDFW